ncbi:MAG TPA: FAD-dependent oxidoreductase [Anaerolineae bacterium]|nr:FAD-dependent oxidoreductase [Anaerolineae bacterium]
MSGKKVIVLGGGVGGMSAAHELAERGFEVHVFERWDIPGGKARSIPKPHSGTQGRLDLPGEHGFRFFPRFYKHVVDTMKRIPYGNNPNGVYDNLVETTRIDVTRFKAPGVQMLSRFPHSLSDLKALLGEVQAVESDIGLKPGELDFFAERIWQIMTSCEARRADEYERIAWWDYIGAGSRSEGYQKFLAEGLTRSLVAADAKVASTKIEGDIGLQLFLDLGTPGVSADRVLDGPTNDVWINPWLAYLQKRGVHYHLKHRLEFIHCVDGVIQSVTVAGPDGPFVVTGDYYVVAVPVEVMGRFLRQEQHKPILKADPGLEGIIPFSKNIAWMNGLQLYLNRDVPIAHGHVIYLDSPWAVTSISQKQFWPDFDLSQYGNGDVRGIISVDISDWNAPGVLYKKPAKRCTREEIKNEVWEELKRSLNVDGQVVLKDEDLVTWFFDSDIEDRDRSAPEKYEDAEPLFIAPVNTWHLRPDAYTRIPNLFIAADYVRTYTQLATMEAANEAARRAVNAIVDASGASAPYCKLWPLHEPIIFSLWRWWDQRRYDRSLPWTDEAPWAVSLAQNLFNGVYSLWRKIRG